MASSDSAYDNVVAGAVDVSATNEATETLPLHAEEEEEEEETEDDEEEDETFVGDEEPARPSSRRKNAGGRGGRTTGGRTTGGRTTGGTTTINTKSTINNNNDVDVDDDDAVDGFPEPVVSNSTVEFSLASVQPHLVCTLCHGYYREPFTITECLHTFCKSCLFFRFHVGHRKCPTCEVSLEPDPYRVVLGNRTLHELVHKILGPSLQEQDDVDEKEFYRLRGIRKKPEYRDSDDDDVRANDADVATTTNERDAAWSSDPSKKRNHPHSATTETTDNNKPEETEKEEDQRTLVHKKPRPTYEKTADEIDFTLYPDENEVQEHYAMPPLRNPIIRTSGRIKVLQLRKYLLKKLDISDKQPSSVEISCNGDRLGDELSLTFVYRTRWFETEKNLALSYRYAHEGLY